MKGVFHENLIVGQSGGPTAVINSSLYGVIQEGLAHSEEIGHVYGMINGIQGFLKGKYMDLAELDSQTLTALRTTPGAISVPAAISFPRIFPIRSMQNFSGNSRNSPSAISYTSAETTPWTP